MPVITTILARHDFKYGATDWRGEIAETFQKTQETDVELTVADGQIVKTVETIWEFADAIAEQSVQVPEVPLTFLFADGTYRKDAAYIFQKTHIKTTTWEAYGDTSYLITIADYDVLARKLTVTTSIVEGKIPLAPTVNSALTNLVQQPITERLEDNCDYVASRTTIDNIWMEDWEDGVKAAKRANQRAQAILRRLKRKANPLMKIGDTIRLVAAKRGLDGRHVLTRKTTNMDENGGADHILEMEFWTR